MSEFTVTPVGRIFTDTAGVAERPVRTVIGVPSTVVWSEPTESPSDADADALADVPDLDTWAASLSDDDRLGLIGRADTHALLGEPAEVLDTEGQWTRVVLPAQPSSKHPRGYPGWVRTAHLTNAASIERGTVLGVVRGARSVVSEASDGERLRLSFGTVLPLAPSASGGAGAGASTLTLVHPDGRTLTVDGAAVVQLLPDGDTLTPAPDSAEALALAQTFAGTPYLWAGLSSAGVDCSGLVHLAYRALGFVVPRDADDQALSGRSRPLTEVRPGDPVFFAGDSGVHHVALATGEGTGTFHAPRTGRPVAAGNWDDIGYAGETVTTTRLV